MSENSAIAITTGGELIVLAAIMGAVIGDVWLLPSPISAESQSAATRLRVALWRLRGPCLILFVGTAVVELILRTASMSGLPLEQVSSALNTVLSKTHYGQLWLWRTVAVLGMIIIWLIQWRRKPNPLLSASNFIALLIIVISLSASGHAGDDGILSTDNFANALHILGALMWGGGIIAFALVILPPLMRGSESNIRALLAASSLRLSTVAGIALTLTILPGIYNAWSLVGSWHGLWTTYYGRLLVVKTALVAGMITLGAVNRYRCVPALQIQAGRSRQRTLIPLPRFLGSNLENAATTIFLRILRVEAVLLLAVLSLAALLSQQVPAAHAEHGNLSGHTHAVTSR